jgi:hypothetical protein
MPVFDPFAAKQRLLSMKQTSNVEDKEKSI